MPYLTPDEVPEGTTCRPLFIPDDTAWLALVSGILTEGAKTWNWEKYGTLTPEECAAVIQDIVNQFYTEGCDDCTFPDDTPIMRLGEDGLFEQFTEGEWSEPTGDYVIPPPDARTEPTEEERICLAAANAANVLQLLYEEITDAYAANLPVANMVALVVIAATSLIALPVGLTIAALFVPLFGLWQMAYNVVEFVTDDFWTTSFTTDLTCALRRQATDTAGVVTFDYNAMQAELINQIDWFDHTISSYTLAGQVRWLLAQLGEAGLNLAGTTTAITSYDCDVCETCTGDSIDFSTGTHSFITAGFEFYAGVGTHMSNFFGTGWYADTAGGSNQIGIAGSVNSLCGTGVNINLSLTGGAPTTPTMTIRVTTSAQVKNATFVPVNGSQDIFWDEGGSIVPDAGLVEIGYLGASGYAAFIQSFQTGDI